MTPSERAVRRIAVLRRNAHAAARRRRRPIVLPGPTLASGVMLLLWRVQLEELVETSVSTGAGEAPVGTAGEPS